MTKEQISNAIETYKKVYMTKNGFPAGTMGAVAISALDGLMEYIGKLPETESKVNPKAVEGEVVKDINNKLAVTAKNVNLDGFKFGDRVKIIIVKDDGK